jgi:hypothetical protein
MEPLKCYGVILGTTITINNTLAYIEQIPLHLQDMLIEELWDQNTYNFRRVAWLGYPGGARCRG